MSDTIVSREVDTAVAAQRTLRALVFVLVAVSALGMAFVYAGGSAFVTSVLAEPPAGSPVSPAEAGAATSPGAPSTTPSATSSSAVAPRAPRKAATVSAARLSGIDRRSEARMFGEQIASQTSISELAAGKFSSFSLSPASKGPVSATVRVTARYRSGGSFSGTMGLSRFGGRWYFAYISASSGAGRGGPMPAGIDSGVTHVITSQQAQYQSVITGIISGGYRRLTLGSPSGGSGTLTIPCTLSGGSKPARKGSLLLISKTLGARKYWFIASMR